MSNWNAPMQGQTYDMPEAAVAEAIPGLPGLKPEDYQHFGKLLDGVDEDTLTPEEANDRRVLKLLLKVKNGTPPQRKVRAACTEREIQPSPTKQNIYIYVLPFQSLIVYRERKM